MKLLRLLTASVYFLAATGISFAQTPVNNACSGAIDISSSFGQPLGTVVSAGPYDNTYANVHATDPVTGFECFGEPDGSGISPNNEKLHNTVWFTFAGDGGMYLIESGQCNPALSSSDYIKDGDTQFAFYKGSCGALTPVACSEDGPSATMYEYPAGIMLRTYPGVTYYLMVDGFSYNHVVSRGKFCLLISKMPDVTCTDPGISTGSVTASATQVCPGQTVYFQASGVATPNVGDYFGVTWVVTHTDLMGNANSIADPNNLFAFYGLSSPAPVMSSCFFTNDSLLIDGSGTAPYGIYYWTPIVYGMAGKVSAGNPQHIYDLYLDPGCTFIGTSVPVEVLPPGHTLCLNSIPEAANNTFGIKNLYPVPVQNQLAIEVNVVTGAELTIEIKDVLGRSVETRKVISTTGSNTFTIDTGSQTAGVYFVTITDGNQVAVSKFVKE